MTSPKKRPTDGDGTPSTGRGSKGHLNEEGISREWAFGVRAEVRGVVVHLDNDRVLYPAGHALVAHTVSDPRQTFVPLDGENALVALAISEKRDLLALCMSGSMASVEIWNTETMTREKVLASTDVASKTFISASFSSENKMLVAQGGEPDWTLVLFAVEKGKVFSTLRLTDTQEFGSVSSVKFHPTDTGVVSVVGENILRLMRLHDKLLKTWGFPGGHEHSCVCQEWVDSHILLIGTTKATVLVLEDGDLRTQLTVTHTDFVKWSKLSTDGKGSIAELGISLLPRHKEVTALKGFDGGFLCACGPDKIFVFTKSENIHEFFTQRFVMRLCEPSPAARVSGRGDHTITCISISPDQKEVVAATQSSQLFKNKMPSQEENQLQCLVFSPLHSLYHEGCIIDMDCSLWKPIVATTGKDKTLRIWDLLDHKLLFQHSFKEEIYSVAMHPTGLHVALGLTDALHLYHVMFDGVRHYSEFKIRRCGLSRYSWGGQHLAAADMNLLTLFSTIFLRRITTLKGHTNKITGIAWLPDDSALVSCSSDGGIFGWDLQTSSVAWEVRTNECRYLATGMIVVEAEGPTILSGCSDKIYHLNIGQMVEECGFSFGSASCIAFAPAKRIVVLGTTEGNLVTFVFPALLTTQPTKFGAHASSITSIVITRDEEKMITCGADGVVLIWKLPTPISDESGSLIALEKVSHLPKIPEMLVAKKDIANMLQNLNELEKYVQYLKKDKSHHLGLQTKEFESIKAKMEATNEEMVLELQKKIRELEQTVETQKENHAKETLKLDERFSKIQTDFKEELREKLIFEYEKQEKIEERLEQLKLKSEEEKKEWEEKSNLELQKNLNLQEAAIADLNHQLETVTAELEQERMQGAQLLRLVEASTEVELSKVRSSLHAQLAEEQARATSLREERASLQRKIAVLETNKESLTNTIRQLEHGKKEALEKMTELETNLVSLRREVLYRNKIIADKEEELTRKNSDIEEQRKLAILKDHEIGWLKSQLEPAEEALLAKANQIQQIEDEISDARLQTEGRDRQVRTLSQRLSAAQEANCRLRQRLHVANTRTTRFQNDVANTSKDIHNPKRLRDAVKGLAEKYLEKTSHHEIWTRTFLTAEPDSDEKDLQTESAEVHASTYKELLRQRHLLENAVETLQKKAKKDNAAHRSKMMSLQKENRLLVDRVKSLTSKMTQFEDKIHDLSGSGHGDSPHPRKRGDRGRGLPQSRPRKTLSLSMQNQISPETQSKQDEAR